MTVVTPRKYGLMPMDPRRPFQVGDRITATRQSNLEYGFARPGKITGFDGFNRSLAHVDWDGECAASRDTWGWMHVSLLTLVE